MRTSDWTILVRVDSYCDALMNDLVNYPNFWGTLVRASSPDGLFIDYVHAFVTCLDVVDDGLIDSDTAVWCFD